MPAGGEELRSSVEAPTLSLDKDAPAVSTQARTKLANDRTLPTPVTVTFRVAPEPRAVVVLKTRLGVTGT